MWSTRFIQRSVRMYRSPRPWRNLQWQKMFSTTTFSMNERVFYPNNKIKNMEDFEKYAGPAEKKHLEMITSEFHWLCSQGSFTNIDLTDQEWLQHMNYESKRSRFGHLKRIQRKRDKIAQKVLRGPKVRPTYPDNGVRRFFKDIFSFSENMIIQNRVARGMMLEAPILMDLSHASELAYDEIENVVAQLLFTFGVIKNSALVSDSAIHIVLCDIKPSLEENMIFKKLMETVPGLTPRDLVVDVTEKSYLDLYPREDLVYLTPDAEEYYHPSDGIPIIGGIVDKRTTKKLSFIKARSEKVKIKRLPIDLVDTIHGNKHLTLNQVVDYVHRLQTTWDPNEAKKALPRRKFRYKRKLLQNPARKSQEERDDE